MRRVFFLCFLWVLCLTVPTSGRAKPWGALNSYVEDTHHKYAVEFLISNSTIYYNVADDVTPAQEAVFVRNIKKWPNEVLRIIREEGRESTFKDIIPVLETKLVLKKRADNPDVFLKLGEKSECGGRASGCFSERKTPAEIIVVSDFERHFSNIVLHEIGHFFGLGDQYERSRYNSHAEYSSDVNDESGSVMNDSSSITCDDADGFINLIDIFYIKHDKEKISERTKTGWASLCPGGTNFYQNGKTINRKTTDIIHRSYTHDEVRTYNKGSVTDTTAVELPDRSLLFDTYQAAKITRENGLITMIKTPLKVFLVERPDEYATSYTLIEDRYVYWTRTFQYQPKRTEGLSVITPVVVTEYIDKDPQTPYEIQIHEDGDLIHAPYVRIANSSYNASISNTTRVLKFELNKTTVQNFRISQWNQSSKKEDVFEGHPGDVSFHASIGGASFTCSPNDFFENPCSRMADYYESYQAHLRNLESFYKNFYKPLFGSQRANGNAVDKVAIEVRDELHRKKNKGGAATNISKRKGKKHK